MPRFKNSLNSKSATRPMNVISEISTVVRFLNFFGFCRYTTNAKGVLQIRDIRLKCVLLSISYLLFSASMIALRFLWSYWKYSWELRAYIELVETIILQCLFLVIMYTAASESEVTIRNYFSDLQNIDDILEINTEVYYSAERRYINIRFFSLTIAYLIKMLCETSFWSVPYGIQRNGPFLNNVLGGIFQLIAQFFYFVRLSIFKLRLRILIKKLEEEMLVCNGLKDGTSSNRFTKVLIKYKVCYALLYSQHDIINQLHGLKLMLGITCILISVIRTIYSIPLFADQEFYKYIIAACAVRTVPDVMLLIALVIYVGSINNLREHALHMLERLIYTQRLSEDEQTSVLRFIEQIQRQPLRFTAHNLFVLDYSLLCGLLHSIVTYIIILTEIKAPTSKY